MKNATEIHYKVSASFKGKMVLKTKANLNGKGIKFIGIVGERKHYLATMAAYEALEKEYTCISED